MDEARFREMVARLERESTARPGAYRAKVAALAALGFAVLFVVLGSAGLALAALAGGLVAIAQASSTAWLFLLKGGKLVFVLAVPVWLLLKSSVKAVFVRLPTPEGRTIERAEAPALFDALENMRTRLQGPSFHQVLIVDDLNAAVVQRPAFGLVGWPRNYLLLGLPLLESLSAREALAVVAHEYGHLAGSHGRFTAFIYRLRHTFGTVQAHTEALEGWVARLVSPLMTWYAPYFNAYTFVLARANEFEADAASVDLVGAEAAANALKRVDLIDPRRHRFLTQHFERVAVQPEPPPDLMQRWAEQAIRPFEEPEAVRWLKEALDREGHYSDTHPTLRARLVAMLGQGQESFESPPPPLEGDSAAEAFFDTALPDLREALQSSWCDAVRAGWTERHGEIARDRARLDALRALAERTGAEELECFQMTMALEPDVDLREELAQFNRKEPVEPLGLYLEGIERLKREDDAGVPLLEQVMAMDAESTLPACERIHRHLTERGRKDEARPYAERWQTRQRLEQERAVELGRLDPKVEVQAHGLSPEELDGIRAQLDGPVVASVRRLRIARRKLVSDPSVVAFVVGVEVVVTCRSDRKRQAVVDGLVALDWPGPVMVVELRRPFGGLKKRFAHLPEAQLWPWPA